MSKLLPLSALTLLPLLAATASAGSLLPGQGLDAELPFEAQRVAIVQALEDGKTYSEMLPEDRRAVHGLLDSIAGQLVDVQAVGQLPDERRGHVLDEQEKANSLLARALADSRLVCKREKPIGSNRVVNQCATVAQRRRVQQSSAGQMQRPDQASGLD